MSYDQKITQTTLSEFVVWLNVHRYWSVCQISQPPPTTQVCRISQQVTSHKIYECLLVCGRGGGYWCESHKG